MTIKAAMKVLYTDMAFLGMDFERFSRFIQESPGAQKSSVLKAFKVYCDHKNESER